MHQKTYIAVENIKGSSTVTGDTENWVLKSDYEALDKQWREAVGPLVIIQNEVLNYLYWREDDLIGDDLKGDGKLTARYKSLVSRLQNAISDFEAKVGK